MFKKFIGLMLLLLTCFMFVACSKGEENKTNGSDPGSSTGEKTPDNPGGGGKTRKTVVTYCNWNFGTEEENNLVRRRVDAFNKSSSTIRIEMVTPVGGSYDEFIATLASAQELPDVFMVNSVPTAIINKWARDISDLVANDSEWEDIPEALRESITYNDKVFGIPAGQYYMGLFANLELIDNYLIGSESAEEKFYPGNFTTDEWIEVVKSMRDINHTDQTGVIGMNAVGDMLNWLPGVLDKTGKTKHFTWNGTGFDFTSESLIDALRIITDLGDPTSQYVFQSIPETVGEGDNVQDYRANIFGPGSDEDVFKNGRMGFIQQGSWAGTYENTDFDCMFTSYPDARVVAATDYFCISRSAKNPEAAYEVAKYLTFGRAGAEAMFKIMDENPDSDLTITCIPLNTQPDISEKWFSYIKMRGLQETFEEVEKGNVEVIVEGNKYIPGFLKARYTFNTGISFDNVRDGALLTIGDFLWDTCLGKISVNDYIATMTQELCDKINKLVAEDYEAMGLKLGE